jgi:two-component system, cell cycle response regulator
MTNTNQSSNESAIDFTELLDRVDNDRELLLDLMAIFKEDFPRHIRELTDVIAARDLEKLGIVSHTLKGMLANLAVTRAATAAAKLEQLAHGGATEPEIADAFHAFQREVQGLVLEMEALSRRLLEKTLERAGYEVIAVENGLAAVRQLCQADGPRLALLDWIMPELDGPGVCREVRRQQDESYVYMVLLTSKESKEDIVTGLESGADDYLTKPFNVEELKARLRTGERILHLEGRLVEAREMMRFKATHDALTSIWNRGVIMDLLGRELMRSQRESGCTIVLLGDVDHFKAVNDTDGHLVGDEVLQEIARRLLLSIRSYDFVGRYGGEEFLLVLNNCKPQFAEVRAEDIRKIVSSRPIQTLAGPLQITMSFGLLLSDGWGVRPVEELLHEVDAALYAAKAAGRNCVRIARPSVGPTVSQLSIGEPAQRLR